MTPSAVDQQALSSVLDQALGKFFVEKWWLGVIALLLPALGSLLALLLGEYIKGRVSVRGWFTQESWKEKYRLYIELLGAIDTIARAAAGATADNRVIKAFPPKSTSSLEAGGIMFPELKENLDDIKEAQKQLAALALRESIMLPPEASAAREKLGGVITQAYIVVNISYFERMSRIENEAFAARKNLLEVAKRDLRI